MTKLEHPDRPSMEFTEFLDALNKASRAREESRSNEIRFQSMSYDEMVQDSLWNRTEQTMADAEEAVMIFIREKLGFRRD